MSESPAAARTRTAVLLPASLALHGVLLLTLVVAPVLMPEALPPPASELKLFFVSPVTVPPPPPPPPAPASVTVRPRSSRPEAPAFVAPEKSLAEIVPEDVVALGVPSGEPGGVEGGVPGGVVGGVVGGLLPEPLASLPPVRVGGEIKEPSKLRHVNPIYPDLAIRANVQGSIIVECIVSPQGRVTAAKILRGIPLLDAAALAAVKQWVYTPTLRDGVPVPVILTVTVQFALR